jgi:hypothetical protein
MTNLEGKVICNAFMKCNDHDNCNHRIPHEHSMFCRMACGAGGVPGGTCVPITRPNDQCMYTIESIDGFVTTIPEDPAPAIPEFNMDENRSAGCISECYYRGVKYGYNCNEGCREANNEEILQLFREHEGENQHIDDLLKEDDRAYSEFMEEITKPMPEKPKPTHERVKRFMNLEL